MFEELIKWYSEKLPQSHSGVSETRDVFEGRLQRLYNDLTKAGFYLNEASLIYAVTGEIGNNSFDHNLGHWKDQPGCFFEYEVSAKRTTIVVADRGRGIKSSLKRVVPSLGSDQDAINLAFEKRISGRSPEKRGNGLKFVREVINSHPHRALVAQSGSGRLILGSNNKFQNHLKKILGNNENVGTIFLIEWEQP